MTVKEYDVNELTKLCTRAFMVWSAFVTGGCIDVHRLPYRACASEC